MLRTRRRKPDASDDLTMVPLGQDDPEIRETIRAICEKYPGKYWRDLRGRARFIPERSLGELGDAGLLAALDPGTIWRRRASRCARARSSSKRSTPRSGCMANHCYAQMYMMEMLLRHGNDDQKKRYLHDTGAAGKATLSISLGVTEPTTGSRPRRGERRARCATATTTWSTARRCSRLRRGSPDLMTLLVRTTPSSARRRSAPRD